MMWGLVLPMLAIGPAAASPTAVPPPIAQDRADCARPQYASDRLICADDALRVLDEELAVLAARQPSLGRDALWEDQPTWIRRRSHCAFKADHRACLIEAYADRRAVLAAAASGSPARPLRCDGLWAGRRLTIGDASPARAIRNAADGTLVAIASPPGTLWQPRLVWQPTARGGRLRLLDGKPFDCRLIGAPATR